MIDNDSVLDVKNVDHLVQTPSASSSSSGEISVDDMSDSSSNLPASFVNAANYITIKEGCQSALTVEELTEAVERCKDLVIESKECSEERKWLVRRLIELRHRLEQAKECQEDERTCKKETQVLQGHHFTLEYSPASAKKRYCDRCCGLIWNVVQSWYQCIDCQYKCHIKCLEQTERVCAHLIASENPNYEMRICPEVGLAAQGFRCYECHAHITFTFPKGYQIFYNTFSSENSMVEARLCDYNGRYYCPSCHWNSACVVPARASRNWDFEPRPVSRASYQLLRHMRHRPLITLNKQLYVIVEDLSLIRRLREELSKMKQYISTCRFALENKDLMEELEWRRHLVHSTEVFSLNDIVEMHNNILLPKVKAVHAKLMKHIKQDCTVCHGRGFVCEFCKPPTGVIYPFDYSTYTCEKCNSVYHKMCWTRNQVCPKCQRNLKKTPNSDD